MILTHKIALDLTIRQANYFARAAGTARFVFNWGLAEWDKKYAAGGKPNANTLKRQFNAIYKEEFPWVGEVHRDCHSQPFADLGTAFANFFAGHAGRPAFKKKHKSRPSFYVANDKFELDGKSARLPVIGWVRLRESLRFAGKIQSGRVVRDADRWFLCVSVDVGDCRRERIGEGIVGVDLGIKTLATISTPREDMPNPQPLKKAQKKLRRENRKLHRCQKGSVNRRKQAKKLARVHRRIMNIRHDAMHKLTSRLCRENQAVGVEDLHVVGMAKNHCLAQSISDAAFGLFRRLLAYKAPIWGTIVALADRFFPSSKMCADCGHINDALTLKDREWLCQCGKMVDRDHNASLNLEKIARASCESTPVDRKALAVSRARQ